MRKESCPSISSRSAVSKRMLAIALLSTHLKINQTEAEESFAHTPAFCARQLSERHYWKGLATSVRRQQGKSIGALARPTELSQHLQPADLFGPRRSRTQPDRLPADSCSPRRRSRCSAQTHRAHPRDR